MKKRLSVPFIGAIAAFCCLSSNADTLIHAGQVFDGVNLKLYPQRTIVVEGDRIKAIQEGYKEASGTDRVIDLRNSTVMPGLMDMHVHLSFQQSGTQGYLERYTLNESDVALRAAYYAEKTLMAGFTTVRNLGDTFNETVALRRAIDAGIHKGPRIFTAAKSIATTGGHADPTNGIGRHLRPDVGPEQGVVNGVAQAREAVRQRYKDGADLIKITATGGVLSVAKSGQNPQFMQDELEAIVNTANDYGMHVAVHAHGTEGMKRAVLAGVTTIEHGTYMDKEVMTLMKKKGTYYVPTIMAGAFVAEKAKIDGYFPALVRPKAAQIGPLIQATFANAYKAGVKIAFGTDSGVSAHGDNGKEFALMAAAGMPVLETLKSATSTNARLLGIDDKLGQLQADKLADIVAVPGNPVDDVNLMQQVNFVMKGGEIVKQP